MKNYLLILKSHCEFPDYERQIEAENKYDAVRKLQEGELCDWEGQVLLDNLIEV